MARASNISMIIPGRDYKKDARGWFDPKTGFRITRQDDVAFLENGWAAQQVKDPDASTPEGIQQQQKLLDKAKKQVEFAVKRASEGGFDPDTSEKILKLGDTLAAREGLEGARTLGLLGQPSTQLDLSSLPSSPATPGQSTFRFGGATEVEHALQPTQTIEDILREVDVARSKSLESGQAFGDAFESVETPTQNLQDTVAPPVNPFEQALAQPTTRQVFPTRGGGPQNFLTKTLNDILLGLGTKVPSETAKGGIAGRRPREAKRAEAQARPSTLKFKPDFVERSGIHPRIQSKLSQPLKVALNNMPFANFKKIEQRITELRTKMKDEKIIQQLEEHILNA